MTTLKPCAHCGTSYLPHTPRAMYCSSVCKNAAWRQSNREKVRASNRASGAAWYAKLTPEKKRERIAAINQVRSARSP